MNKVILALVLASASTAFAADLVLTPTPTLTTPGATSPVKATVAPTHKHHKHHHRAAKKVAAKL